MKNHLLLFSLFFISTYLYSQKIISEKVLSPPGKSLGLISVFGLKTALSGTGPGNSHDLTSALDFINLEGEGFVIRKDYKFSMYNNDSQKIWETEIEKVYGLQAMPRSFTIGNKNAIYFVQISSNPSFNQMHLTRFDAQGKSIATKFITKNIYDGISGSFINNDGLSFILYKVNKKEKTIKYTLIAFSPSDLTVKEKPLPLESSDYEVENVNSLVNGIGHIWTELVYAGNKMVLTKIYLKEIEGSKLKDLVVKTIEVSSDGSVSVAKQFEFVPTALKDSKYVLPNVDLDTLHNELYVYGMMMVESNSRINGLYVNKFDYNTTGAIYRREMPFSTFNQLIPEKDRKESIHHSFSAIWPVTGFVQSTQYLDVPNHGLRLLLFNDAKGLLKSQVRLTGIRLNKNGDPELIEDLLYKNHLVTFNDFYLIPEKRTVYWKDNNPNYQLGPLDFINSLGEKQDPDYTLCSVFPKKDCNIVVYIRENDGEIKAFKIEKEILK